MQVIRDCSGDRKYRYSVSSIILALRLCGSVRTTLEQLTHLSTVQSTP